MNPLELKERLAGVIDYGDMPEALQSEHQQKLVYRVMRGLATEIMKKIPENRLEEFNMVSDANDPKAMQAFLADYIFNLEVFTDEIIESEVDVFKRENGYT